VIKGSIKEQRDHLIATSPYWFWPDALVTLQIADRLAQLDKRNRKEALRVCARQLVERCPAACQDLQKRLIQMSTEFFPEASLTVIKAKVERLNKRMDVRLSQDNDVHHWLTPEVVDD
jgi:hypothetical protein